RFLDDFLQFSTPSPSDEQPDADGGVARRHGQNRGGGESCGYAASLGQRKRVAHIPTAETEAARSSLILEGQGQARLHLKFNPSWSYEWGPVHPASPAVRPSSAESPAPRRRESEPDGRIKQSFSTISQPFPPFGQLPLPALKQRACPEAGSR